MTRSGERELHSATRNRRWLERTCVGIIHHTDEMRCDGMVCTGRLEIRQFIFCIIYNKKAVLLQGVPNFRAMPL